MPGGQGAQGAKAEAEQKPEEPINFAEEYEKAYGKPREPGEEPEGPLVLSESGV